VATAPLVILDRKKAKIDTAFTIFVVILVLWSITQHYRARIGLALDTANGYLSHPRHRNL
jgi:hypothetical protein